MKIFFVFGPAWNFSCSSETCCSVHLINVLKSGSPVPAWNLVWKLVHMKQTPSPATKPNYNVLFPDMNGMNKFTCSGLMPSIQTTLTAQTGWVRVQCCWKCWPLIVRADCFYFEGLFFSVNPDPRCCPSLTAYTTLWPSRLALKIHVSKRWPDPKSIPVLIRTWTIRRMKHQQHRSDAACCQLYYI